jgi:hypothetical protein
LSNPRTARDTRGRLNLHFLGKFGGELVSSLTKGKLEGWLNSLVFKGPDREAIRRSKDTANRVLSMVKALLNHALRDPANGISDDHAWRLVKPSIAHWPRLMRRAPRHCDAWHIFERTPG